MFLSPESKHKDVPKQKLVLPGPEQETITINLEQPDPCDSSQPFEKTVGGITYLKHASINQSSKHGPVGRGKAEHHWWPSNIFSVNVGSWNKDIDKNLPPDHGAPEVRE